MEAFGYSHPVTPYPLPDLGTHCPVSAGPMSCNPSLDCLPGASEAQGSAYQPRPRLAQLHHTCHSLPHFRHQAWLTLRTTVADCWLEVAESMSTHLGAAATTPPPTDIQRNPRPEHDILILTQPPPTETHKKSKKCPKIAAHANRAHPPRRTPTSRHHSPVSTRPRSDPKITLHKKPKVPTHAFFLTVCHTLRVSVPQQSR